jgi:hypothetical protein
VFKGPAKAGIGRSATSRPIFEAAAFLYSPDGR